MHETEITIYNAVIFTFLIFGTIVTLLIVSMMRQHNRNIELYKMKISAEITTLENERKRISADLHDDLGPMLSAIKFKISSVDAEDEDLEQLKQAESYIDDVIQKLRQISNDLMPGTLLRKGLAFAVEEFIQKVSGLHNLVINFTHSSIPSLPDETCVNLYRIILEIVHNALKHSHATNLNINLSASEKRLKLSTADNGKGFDYLSANKKYKGLGLRNILSRTELLGGEMYVESASGEGTSYVITIPVKD
jgi:signal transduction histidine kinase